MPLNEMLDIEPGRERVRVWSTAVCSQMGSRFERLNSPSPAGRENDGVGDFGDDERICVFGDDDKAIIRSEC